MYRILYTPSLVLIGLLSVSCATSNAGRGDGNIRIYKSDTNNVIEQAANVLAQLNLNIEDQGWEVQEERFEISAYELNRVFRGTEGTVRSASVLVVIEKLTFNETRVTFETSRRGVPSMASSADHTVNHERAFFSRLDEILPIVEQAVETPEASQAR